MKHSTKIGCLEFEDKVLAPCLMLFLLLALQFVLFSNAAERLWHALGEL
jgi:hypothetical protein